MTFSKNRYNLILTLAIVPIMMIAACEPAPETADDAPVAQPAGESPVPPTNDTAAGTESAAVEGAGLNMNTATSAEFRTIPGVGDHMVEEFFEYRPYVSIRQFRREIGKYVDEAQVAEYERYIFVPVDANESDAATLEQIPGVDATVSAELIAGRPYASDQAFLDALAARVSEAQAASAEEYLSGS